MALAISSPMVLSLLAEMDATCAISSFSWIILACFLTSSTASATAMSIPLLMPIGLTPDATLFMPSLVIAHARTVAVVVPSPATSLVLDATSLRSCAPMFSNGSSSSISLATETPSFVTVGAPYFLSRRTSLPLGPRVVMTAFEIFSTRSCFAISIHLSLTNPRNVMVPHAPSSKILINSIIGKMLFRPSGFRATSTAGT